MIGFATPWLLAGLAVLPGLWWLLRVTPPAPRVRDFPAIGLLLGLTADRSTPARTPWWLLALRLAAAGVLIVGLAGPIRNPARPAAAAGPVLLIMDDGWAAAADWAERIAAASRAAADAAAPGATVWLLTTAPSADGSPPRLGPAMAEADLAAVLAVLRPQPWPTDRGAGAALLARLPAATRVIYVGDGIAGARDEGFAAALHRFGAITELRGRQPPILLRPPVAQTDPLGLRAETLPGAGATLTLRVEDAAGHALAQEDARIGRDGMAEAALVLPPALRDRAAALRLAAGESAGGVILLDEGAKRRPVGLVAPAGAEETPLTGPLFYVRRALARSSELRTGPIGPMLRQGVSLIVLADMPLADPQQRLALTDWVRRGGVLVRFAGPNLAAGTSLAGPAGGGGDTLLPVTLLAGDRALGGAMSWARPAGLAPFPAGSPFAGLAVPADIRVSRQVLATPGGAADQMAHQDWAALEDGTPLVTAAPLGAGQVVLFHVTANADWSTLPLSGLFPQMLRRLVALSAGIRIMPGSLALPPRRVLDGFGRLGPPGAAAQPLAPAALRSAPPDPRHPPGLYGPPDAPTAFNLGAVLPPLAALPAVAGEVHDLAGTAPPRPYGPALVAAALLLLALDLLLSLRLRGLIGAAATLLLLAPLRAEAQAPPPMPSLATHLAYVLTGDGQADGIARAGLRGLSDYVTQRTAAILAEPVGVDPGRDELSFYPLLYWPVLSGAAVPDGATIARLDSYMEDGGIILFDTRDAGAPDAGAQAALRRLGAALSLPALTPMSFAHVLSHSFYLLHEWPGRWDSGTVWVAQEAEHTNDGVSPVIVGDNDWAAAWATDDAGDNPYPVSSGTAAQRVLAYRFGVNLVIYALTGNYKADQSQVPELLRRMKTDPAP